MSDAGLAWSLAQPGLLAAITNPKFDALHPRGGDGRFLDKGGWIKYLDIAASIWVKASVEDFTSDGQVKIKRIDNGAELLKKPSELYSVDKPKATLNPAGWKKTGGQAGSNPGGFFDDHNGDKWYVKTPKNKMQVGNENLANQLYRAAGAPAPETAVSPNGSQFLTKIEKSEAYNTLPQADKDKVQAKIRENFVVDAWLANWDATHNDNLRVTPDGIPLRVDAGGSIMFRARGGKRNLTPNVGELQSMRDPTIAYSGSQTYAGLTRAEEEDALKRILAISPDTIRAMVKDNGLPPQTATDLIARRVWLANHYGFQLPETTVEGKKLLDELSKTPDSLTKTESAAVKATVRKIAPDTAVPLALGAPVWLKDKSSSGSVTPAGAKVPDIMLVSEIQDDAGVTIYDLSSQNGKVHVGGVSGSQFEVLRENFASPASRYAGGESPQIGDRVDGKHGPGTILELFPLYSRVQLDDGSVKVIRVKSMTRTAQAGTDAAKPPDGVAVSRATSPGGVIGTPADVSNPTARFPVVAFSLPHRADVLVLSNDGAGKSVVLLGDGRKGTVADSKLFDPESVDKMAVKSMPVRTPGTRGPRAQTPLDVTTLPAKEIQPNRNVKMLLSPGDRIFKVKVSGRAEINFLKLTKDGELQYAGSSKGHVKTDANGYIDPEFANSIDRIYRALSSGSPEDITPPKYDVAAEQIGAKHVNTDKYYTPQKVSFTRYLDVDPANPTYSRRTETVDISLKPMPGDRIDAVKMPNAPEWGFANRDVGTADKNYKQSLWLTRNGTLYDLGFNGENAGDPSKWVKRDISDQAAVKSLRGGYWYPHSGKPMPITTLSDGTVLSYNDVSNQGNYYTSARMSSSFNESVATADTMSGTIDKTANVAYLPFSGQSAFQVLQSTFKTSIPAAATSTSPDGTVTVSPVVPGQIPDITSVPGFNALGHRITTTREQIQSGELDDQLHKVMETPIVSNGTLHTLPDGTVHGDPFMAQFTKEVGGDQNSLLVAPAVFTAIRSITGDPVLHRGVSTPGQRDAIKSGDHFTGTGVYGNGTYTAAATSVTNKYGANKVAMTPKPGAKGIDNDEAAIALGEDIASAQRDRLDVLSGLTEVNLPSSTDAADVDLVNTKDPALIAVRDRLKLVRNANGLMTNDEEKTFLNAASTKAAALYLVALEKQLPGPIGLNATPSRYGYGSTGDVITLNVSPPGAGSVSMTFKGPWTPTATSHMRGVAAKLDATKNFTMDVKLDNPAPGRKNTSREALRSAYTSSWYYDNFTRAMNDSGIGDMLGSDWPQVSDRLAKIDSRISFISDAGRWSLAAGYDYFKVPGADYYIFTNRAAFILRK